MLLDSMIWYTGIRLKGVAYGPFIVEGQLYDEKYGATLKGRTMGHFVDNNCPLYVKKAIYNECGKPIKHDPKIAPDFIPFCILDNVDELKNLIKQEEKELKRKSRTPLTGRSGEKSGIAI